MSQAPGREAAYDALLQPSSIAVLGASDDVRVLGGTVYANLRQDFSGPVYPVNARRSTVQGDKAYQSLDDLPGPVDLVVIITPAHDVPELIARCIARGDGAAVIISSGFAETGPGGAKIQEEVARLARSAGFPVLGPNCIGFMNGYTGVMANFSLRPESKRPVAGRVALVSQSGGFGSYILEKAIRADVNVGLFVSTGNEVDVTAASVARYLIERPEVTTLLMFCEALRDPELFLEAADRAVELDKTIVALKTGNSPAVARAALSHTASVVGESAVFDAICQQYGVLRVHSIEEMLDVGLILQSGRRMNGRRIGVATASGGAGVLVADAIANCGLELPALPESDQEQIAPYIPAYGSALNPVDHTAQIAAFPPETFGKILDVMARSAVIDAVLPVTWQDEGDGADGIRLVHNGQAKPIVPAITVGGPLLTRDGIPAYPDPTRAVRALSWLAERSVRARPEAGRRTTAPEPGRAARARELLAGSAGRPFVLESAAKQVLALYGVPVSRELVVGDARSAAQAAAQIGFPVALKALSYELAHKSDSGGLRLGLTSADEVARAYDDLVGALAAAGVGELDGVLVQEMVPAHIEIMCGLKRDPVFGPVVATGIGGTLVEMLGDPALLRVPFTAAEAGRAIRGIAEGRITHPVRGLTEGQIETLARTLSGVSAMADELGEIVSADINPIRVSAHGLKAVDALLVLSGAPEA
jgi:acetyltransferase